MCNNSNAGVIVNGSVVIVVDVVKHDVAFIPIPGGCYDTIIFVGGDIVPRDYQVCRDGSRSGLGNFDTVLLIQSDGIILDIDVSGDVSAVIEVYTRALVAGDGISGDVDIHVTTHKDDSTIGVGFGYRVAGYVDIPQVNSGRRLWEEDTDSAIFDNVVRNGCVTIDNSKDFYTGDGGIGNDIVGHGDIFVGANRNGDFSIVYGEALNSYFVSLDDDTVFGAGSNSTINNGLFGTIG
ncbi:hypothetical protein ES707_21347 [subsurface metagenome]